MKTFACNGEWRGRKITASVLVLDQGIRVDLYGGDLPHIGAVRDTGKPCSVRAGRLP